MFLLNGDVLPQFKDYKKSLRSTPKNVVKSWSKNTPHIVSFVNRLLQGKVFSKQTLLDKWRKKPNCK